MGKFTQRLKRFSDDERAVSPVVGFVLIFALIMIVFTLYQSSVVPAQNKEVEFKHSQTVEGQMSELSSAIQSASADGASRSQTVAIGMNYPTRALAINPGSPAGTLQTKPDNPNDDPIEIHGIDIDGSEYWDGSPTDGPGATDISTKSLSYSINYNLEQNDPEFTIANGVVSKSYDSGTVAIGDSAAMLPGSQHQIDLTLLGGQYQETGLTANPTIEPISTSIQYLHFTANSNSQIGLGSSLTTDQCVVKWVGVGGKNDDDDNIVEFPNSKINCNTHVMELDDGTDYTLRISKIGFGDTSELSDAADAHEVVPTEETDQDPSDSDPRLDDTTAELDATVGEEKSFTVLVRDKYGNPVSDTAVNIDKSNTDPDRSQISPSESSQPKTNEQGKMTFIYTPESDASGTKEIVVSSPDASFEATYKFDFSDSTNDDESDDDSDTGGEFVSGPPTFETVGSITSSSIISFDIQTNQPTKIDGFAIETKYDLSELKETDRTHSFEVNQRSVSYSPPDGQAIRFDGRRYDFTNPAEDVTLSDIQINSFGTDYGDPDIVLSDFVDSPRKADLEVIFFLGDGSQRAVYINGHLTS